MTERTRSAYDTRYADGAGIAVITDFHRRMGNFVLVGDEAHLRMSRRTATYLLRAAEAQIPDEEVAEDLRAARGALTEAVRPEGDGPVAVALSREQVSLLQEAVADEIYDNYPLNPEDRAPAMSADERRAAVSAGEAPLTVQEIEVLALAAEDRTADHRQDAATMLEVASRGFAARDAAEAAILQDLAV